MKKLSTLIMLLFTSVILYSQALKIDSSGDVEITGNVGINGAPSATYNLTVYGNIGATSISAGDLSGSTITATQNLTAKTIYGNPYLSIYADNTGIGTSYASNSSLKIGGENTYALYVSGRAIITSGVWETSDEILKKDIIPVDEKEALNKLLQLRSRTYFFKSNEELQQMCLSKQVSFPQDTSYVIYFRYFKKKNSSVGGTKIKHHYILTKSGPYSLKL